MIEHHPGALAHAIWGAGAKVSGSCCPKPRLCPMEHPFYRCGSCGKKVKLVKVTTIRIKVVDESSAEELEKPIPQNRNDANDHAHTCTPLGARDCPHCGSCPMCGGRE